MASINNPARRRLEAGEVALGFSLRQSRTGDIAAIAATCGFDWLFIDTEHNSIDADAVAQICVAALGAGISPIVRVPRLARWVFGPSSRKGRP